MFRYFGRRMTRLGCRGRETKKSGEDGEEQGENAHGVETVREECQSNIYARDRFRIVEVLRWVPVMSSLIINRVLRLGIGSGVSCMLLMGLELRVKAQNDAAKATYFTGTVKPILDANCARCHGGMNHRGGLNLDTRAGMLKGGHDGPVIVPGDPDKSLLIRLIRHEGPTNDPMPMPPNKPKLSDADIAIVAQWVKAGAVMPDPVTPPQ